MDRSGATFAARRRTYAHYPDHFAFSVWFWWLPAGTRTRILRRRRHQPDHLDCDRPVVVKGHLKRCARWAPAGSGAVGNRLYAKNGDFPHVAARAPPPRNQTSKLEKTTVGAKITWSRGFMVKISGNHLVITFPNRKP